MISRVSSVFIAGACLLQLSACVSVQALEPVLEPPSAFRGDTVVDVEFLPGSRVGARCAERGAMFFGMPAFSAGGCADTQLITIIDPCLTVTAGRYASDLCVAIMGRLLHETTGPDADMPTTLKVASGHIPSPATEARWPSAVRIAFVPASMLEQFCNEQPGRGAAACVAGSVILAANPCMDAGYGWYGRVMCHELAHANGWPASHANVRYAGRLPPASSSPQARAFADSDGQAGLP